MNEVSKLSIVVDVSQAQQKLKDFTRQLNEAKKAGDQLGSSASNSSQGLNNQAQSANKAQLEANKLAISNKKVEAQNNRTSSSIYGLLSAENRAIQSQNNLQASNIKVTTAGKQLEMQNNRTASSAAQLVVSNQRIAITAEQLATAQFKTVTASNQAAASNNRLSVSANQVLISNNRLAGSAATTAAQQTRAQIATVNLSRANWSLVTAATNSSTAQQRLALQTSNAAAAATRAEREAVRLASAQARLQAQLNGTTGAMNRANAASRGLFQNMNKLYTIMNSGLVIYGGLGFVKVAADMQNLNNQIRLVTESEYEYLGMKKEVMKIANENYNDVASTISLYQKSVRALTNLGKSQADSLKFTEAVSLAMRTGGRSAGEQAAAILQLGQAMGAGVIMGDEFRSISENAPVLLDLVAKKMGVLQGDLKKLSADGKITAEIMYEALTENMGTLEELANKMPLTMGQAFIVAKNKFKAYTDEMMNSTGGVSDKITGMLVGISDNFDTIAKVGIAGVVLGLTGMIASLATATKAMQLFNFVTSSNPLMLLVSGFLLVNSAIFGTNDVLTISGIMLSDFFDGMGTMLKDGETWWMDFSATVATAMGITVKEVAEANDKNSKNFLGFYEQTEKGFAGVVQGLGTAIGSVTAIFGTFFEILGRWTDNMFTTFENMGKAAYNAGNRVRMWFGGEDQQQEYGSFKSLDGWSVYKDTFNSNQDYWRDYAQGLNTRSGVVAPKAPNTFLQNRTRFGRVGFDSIVNPQAGSGVYAKAYLPSAQSGSVVGNRGAFNANTAPRDMDAKVAYENRKLQNAADEQEKALKKATAAQDKLTKSTELVRLAVVGGKNWGISSGGGYGGARGHNGIDLPTPIGTQVYAPESGVIKAYGDNSSRGGKQMILIADSGKKYGFAHLDSFDVSNGTRVDSGMGIAKTGKSGTRGRDANGNPIGYKAHLHLTVTDANGKKVDPTKFTINKTKYDNTIGSYNSKIQSEQQQAAQKQAEEAQRKLEEQLRLREQLNMEYGNKELQVGQSLAKKLAEIRSAGYDDETAKRYSEQAEQDAKIELATYQENLDRRIDALDEYQKTERGMLDQERDYAKFNALSNKELLRPENSEYLKYELDAADRIHEHKIKLLNLSQQEETLGLFEYASTDERMFEEGWRLKIEKAKLATDELKDIRIKAYEAEYAKDKELFLINKRQKMLELKKPSMGEGEYLKQVQDLELERIALSNESPEKKSWLSQQARQPLGDAVTAIMDKINPINPLDKLKQDYEAQLEIVTAYESQYTNILAENSAERKAIEEAYQRDRAQLILAESGALFGSLASASKNMLGEQSSTYRTMFALQQSFVIASAGISMYKAISDAMAEGATLTQKFAAAGVVAAEFSTIIGAVSSMQPKGFKSGGYTGNGGISDVAGVVHGKEYVFDAEATRRIGVNNLDAMRRGQVVGGGDVNINVNVDAKGNAQVSGDNERMGRDMANGIKAVVMDVMRKEKRQGGMLYGA